MRCGRASGFPFSVVGLPFTAFLHVSDSCLGSPLVVQSQDTAHGSSAFLPGAMLGGDLNSANGACPSPVGECDCLPSTGT